jgi:hypothetical protein
MTQWQGWGQLPQLPRPVPTPADLEQRWLLCTAATDPTCSEPYGPLGEFFSAYLDEILDELDKGAAVWRVRLQQFVAETEEWRGRLRSAAMKKQDNARLRRTVTALRIWQRLASPTDLDSIEGRWNLSNLESCRAHQQDSGRGANRVRLLRKAADAVDPDRPPAIPATSDLHAAMKRHKLMLESNAFRIESFIKMRRRPQPWDLIAAGFGKAAELSEQAQAIVHVPQERSVSLNRLWESLTLIRAAQNRLDTGAAREQLKKAKGFAADIDDPFRHGGRWSSWAELAAERHVIDCLDELDKEGNADPDLVVEYLQRWLMNTKKGKPPPPANRTTIMNLRHDAAEMARMVYNREDITIRLATFRRTVAVDPYIRLTFDGVTTALQSAARNMNSAYPKVVCALRANLTNVDGDQHSLPPEESTARLTPKWAAGATEETDAVASASLLRYLRVLAEYLWCVYRDTAEELNLSVPQVSGRQFRAMSPTEVGPVISGLKRALAWKDGRYPTIALAKLETLTATISRSTAGGSIIGARDVLSVVLDATLVDLFPLVVRSNEKPPTDFPADIAVVRQVKEGGTELVAGVSAPPPSWPYFALKPRYKQRDRLSQLISQRYTRPIHLYSADSWPTPQSVRVLVEGPSDVAALSAYLDARMPWWRGYDIRFNDCGGDKLPARLEVEQRRLPGDLDRTDHFVIVADADKRTNGTWDRAGIWRHKHSFDIAPDLEMHNLTAFSEALNLAFNKHLTRRDIAKIHLNYSAAKKARVTKAKNFANYLEQELQITEGAIKREECGALVGQRLAHYGSPTLDHVARRIDLLANGFAYDPRPEFPR